MYGKSKENPNDERLYIDTREMVKTAHLGYEGEITICVVKVIITLLIQWIATKTWVRFFLFCFSVLLQIHDFEKEGGGVFLFNLNGTTINFKSHFSIDRQNVFFYGGQKT